jgi:hypothetical protein
VSEPAANPSSSPAPASAAAAPPCPAPAPHRGLARARWVGFAGAVLLAVGAAGAGVLPRPDGLGDLAVIRTLRTDAGVIACIVAAAVGMALLVGAWWVLGRLGGLATRWVVATAAWWSLPLLFAPPLFSRDVYSYAAQGDMLAHGLDPYRDGPAALPSRWLDSISPTWYDTAAPYGPLFLVLARFAVALCGGHLPVAALLLRLVAVGGVALIAVYLPRLARACGVDPGRALWLGLASPLLLTHFVSGAHNDALMVGLLVAGLAYAAERRGVPAAVLLALAAAVKAPALVALPFAALLWPLRGQVRWRVLRAGALTGLVAAATFIAVTVVTGLGLGWVEAALRTPGASIQWTSLPTGLGVAAGWVASVLGHPAAADACLAVARAAGTALTLAIVAALWWWARRRAGDVRAAVLACGLALLAVVLLAPAFHPWYLLWATVPLAAAATSPRLRTGLAVASAALCFLVLPDGFNLARVTVAPGVVLDVLVAAALVALGIRWLRGRTAIRGGNSR